MLKSINRRRSCHAQPIGRCSSSALEMVQFGTDSELQKLRQEKDMLVREILELKQENLVTVQKMDALNHRLKLAEGRQKQMITFLAKVVQNPAFFTRLVEMKEKREIASLRPVRQGCKSTVHPIVKYTMGSFSDRNIPGHLLQDMAHKVDLDKREQEELGNEDKPPEEMPSPLFNPNDSLEGTKPMITEADVSFSCSEFLIPSPGQLIADFLDHLPPVSESFVSEDLAIDTLKGKNALEIKVPVTCCSGYFESSAYDVSQEPMFLDSVTPGFEEEMLSLSFEDAGDSFTSGLDLWDSIDCINLENLAVEDGPSSVWGLGTKSPDEDLDIGKLFYCETPLKMGIVEDDHLRASDI